jgi:hypothetical protein
MQLVVLALFSACLIHSPSDILHVRAPQYHGPKIKVQIITKDTKIPRLPETNCVFKNDHKRKV